MKHVRSGPLSVLLLVAALVAMASSFAYAQGTITAPLTGTVTDTSGAVVPGADVNVKNNATGEVLTAVTGSNGIFTIPALMPGTYTVTVSLMGFKTAVLNNVTINAGVAASVKPVLEVGKLEETVVVAAATEIVQTQTTAVAQTITAKQLATLPLPGRASFDFVALMPGVTSSSDLRSSTVNGLPQSAVNITLDGMNIQDNYAKTWDGMFTRVSPRLDAVEEITVGTAAQGADMAGQGGVQVKFVTRSGTNQYQGSLYYYMRRDWLNSNTWFNLHRAVDITGKPTAKPVQAQYQPGGRFGGPIVIPGLFDGHDKAFFFINYEQVRTPGTRSDTRYIMTTDAQAGWLTYSKGRVNVFDVATAKGQVNTPDPIVAKLLADIRAATATTGVLNDTPGDPLTQTYAFQQKTKGVTKYPTIRLDYNVTTKHKVTASLTQNHLISDPDTTNSQQMRFPGFPVHGLQDSYRWTGQLSLRSIVTKNMVNEVRVGGTGGATFFSPDLDTSMYSASVGNMAGYGIGFNFRNITSPYGSSSNSAREGSTRLIEDTLSWLRGAHSMSMGFSFTNAGVWLANQQLVPTISFGIVQGDPADALMFTTANFPSASSTDLTNAKNLYALLTGRISSIGREARIGEDGSAYNILGKSMQKGRLRQIGFFLQDSWKMKPSFTVNAGLRYDIQYPFYALNNSYSAASMEDIFGITGVGSGFKAGSPVTGLGNLFKPGVLEGASPSYEMLTKDTYGYNVDYNNLSPSIGAAWKLPQVKGFLGRIIGTDAVLRGGYNIAFQRPGMSDFTGVFGGNPGVRIDATRNQTNGNLGTLPVLLRSSDLGAPSNIPLTRQYPMAVPTASTNVYVFDPNITIPYSTSATVGFQRAISKTMAVEARFIHTGSHGVWKIGNLDGYYNYNEVNIIENGFLSEFRNAQANLVANIAAGKSSKGFAYTGAAGTVPLPILLGFLSGKAAGQAGDPNAYSGSGWTSSSYAQYLYANNPNPLSMASSIRSNSTYKANGVAAGYAPNFFVVNPEINNAYVAANGPDLRYNGLQLVLNRRFAQGLQVQANYSYGKGYQSEFYSFRKPFVEVEQNYSSAGTTAGSGNIRHNFSANWVYELPFGQGKRFGGNVGRELNRLIGNWSFMGIARLQSGRIINLGNVRLNGMTRDDVAKMFQLRKTTDPSNPFRTLVFMMPDDVIQETIKAYSFDASGYTKGTPTGKYFSPANGPDCIEVANGFGDCGEGRLLVSGPKQVRIDMSISKRIAVTSRVNFQFDAQVFNVFNNVNFNPVGGIGGVTTSDYEVTSANDSARTMQIAFRINW